MSSKFWSPLVSQLEPYTPGEQPQVKGLIKLNTNENPYPPSPKLAALLDQAAINNLRLYPDPNNGGLKKALSDYLGVATDHICVGNGSDEILAFAFQGLFKPDSPVLFPDITYGFYTVYCSLYGIEYQQLPLAENFDIALDAYINHTANGGVIFPNPNAPTGIAKALDDIEALLKVNTESVVIIDEAYVDFGAESAVSLVAKYPNLLVVQTLSKSRSLAGSRIGFAVGQPDLIEALERIKNCFNPYSLDRLAELAATVAIEDVDYFQACCAKIIATREWTAAELTELGFDILPSKTNFIMAKPNTLPARELFTALREQNIVVRYFSKPRIEEYLRISIGTDAEMQALVAAVKSITAGR
ncbi:histidinol-phosphate transaminase [Oceanicoccus sp. KOV_DT_Chl]|uniref:histidinol-phosphate transaminase n=1 Tax=Oceanicoccus sp. KOV_DT_Chl TaxID=1904639 RepID=UPI000C7DD5A0|nr:histidinol-phosphate transaminase [Oceanicoccus sp. KOV_DT_Chl]